MVSGLDLRSGGRGSSPGQGLYVKLLSEKPFKAWFPLVRY